MTRNVLCTANINAYYSILSFLCNYMCDCVYQLTTQISSTLQFTSMQLSVEVNVVSQ